MQNIFDNKTCSNWAFGKCMRSSICFNFWTPYQMRFTYSKQWKYEFVKYGKFVIQWTKAKVFSLVLNIPLKVWADFTLSTWLWFGCVTWRFSTSFTSTFIQILQNFILKKNFNYLILKVACVIKIVFLWTNFILIW